MSSSDTSVVAAHTLCIKVEPDHTFSVYFCKSGSLLWCAAGSVACWTANFEFTTTTKGTYRLDLGVSTKAATEPDAVRQRNLNAIDDDVMRHCLLEYTRQLLASRIPEIWPRATHHAHSTDEIATKMVREPRSPTNPAAANLSFCAVLSVACSAEALTLVAELVETATPTYFAVLEPRLLTKQHSKNCTT